MLYRPIWFLSALMYRVFFKHFFINYKDFDLKRPTIIVSNHNNAFIDPIVFPTIILPRIYFIVRGDIFNTPLKNWLLWNMGQIPMFRIRDGIDNVKKNEGSFQQTYDLLAKKQNILIFPEGDCVQEKRIRSLKRGTARMAFGAVLKHGWELDLQLLPMLNNYTYPKEFRTEIMVNVGEGILLSDYKQLYLENENKALAKLTNDIHFAMKELYIHINNKEDDELFEKIVILKRNDMPSGIIPWRKKGNVRFDMEKRLANSINDSTIELKKELEEKTKTYFSTLEQYTISDASIKGITPNGMLGLFLTLLGFPLYTIGVLLNIFQFLFAKKIVDEKIKQVTFQNSIRFGILLATNSLIALILIIALSNIHWLLAVLSPIALLLLAFYAINYHEYVQSWLETNRMNKVDSTVIKELKVMRAEILNTL